MSLLAALLPNERDRESLRGAAPVPSNIVWVDSWSELNRVVRDRAVTMVVTDITAEPRRDAALRAYRFHRKFPGTPLVAWGHADGRDLFRLGKAGAAQVVLTCDVVDSAVVADTLRVAAPLPLSSLLAERLAGRVHADAIHAVCHAADRIPEQIQVPQLAAAFAMSVSTLERRCERWRIPSPGRTLLWLRVLYGIRWLLEPGRSVESVAAQLGYSSGAAFRRAIKATVGGRPAPLRSAAGFTTVLDQFIAECGEPA
jgi:AraC-like DNA-binding protein